jgi:hypothetical protein
MSIASTTTAEPRRWIVLPALPLLIAFYASAAFLVAPPTFVRLLADYVRQMGLLVAILLVTLPVASLILRPGAPVERLAQILREGGMRLMAIVVVFCVAMASFTTFKIGIPNLVPFYADGAFADLDAWLHRGDPGALLHAIIPPAAAPVLAFAYGYPWFSLWFGLLAFVALHRDAQLRRRYLWAMTSTFILLGTALATALSSVGPIFYRELMLGDRFDTLMESVLAGGAGPITREMAGYLLAAYHTQGQVLGTGISAMPSMHVAVVTLNALMLSGINRFVGALGWLYAGVIMVASVYLGWHYAIDGYVSIALVSLIWWLCGRVVRIPNQLGLGRKTVAA